jgi:single-strand DNA-binding protein
MLTLTGSGRLTRDVELRSTRSGKSVAAVSVASDRRDRQADPVYVDLILWEGQAEAAAQHLVKGQAVTFAGRLEPRPYQTSSGEQRVAIELHGVDLEYGPRARGQEPAGPAGESPADHDDIPF